MACPLFDAKPLSEPMLVYYQLDPWKQTSVQFELKFEDFRENEFENVVKKMLISRVNYNTSNFTSQPIHYGDRRHNERDGVSNHRRLDCLLNRLLRRRLKKTLKLRVTGLCEGNSPVTGEFHTQRASNAENVSIWWGLHDVLPSDCLDSLITKNTLKADWESSVQASNPLVAFLHRVSTWSVKRRKVSWFFFHRGLFTPEDIMPWKSFPHYCTFVWGGSTGPIDSPDRTQ